LSERHLNDEQFKIATHAFSKIQTMNSINIRHDSDDAYPHQSIIMVKKALMNNFPEYNKAAVSKVQVLS